MPKATTALRNFDSFVLKKKKRLRMDEAIEASQKELRGNVILCLIHNNLQSKEICAQRRISLKKLNLIIAVYLLLLLLLLLLFFSFFLFFLFFFFLFFLFFFFFFFFFFGGGGGGVNHCFVVDFHIQKFEPHFVSCVITLLISKVLCTHVDVKTRHTHLLLY